MVRSKRKFAFFVVLVLLIGGMGVYYLFFSMEKLPKGELIQKVDSPTRKYTLKIYLVRGNLTTGNSIRGEIVFNDSGMRRNLYWGYHERNADVIWIEDNIVAINGRSLNVSHDTYDWRNNWAMIECLLGHS